jgi:TM2 domain-containing membrane protein YozV
MNILKDVVRGASTQFGREFGRAGANAVLKGKNHYTIKNTTDFEGRIKPSDSDIVKAIKEIRKIKFVTTDKANISRLIELTDLANSQIKFKGIESLDGINAVTTLVDEYNDKYEHGEVLVSDGFKDKSLDFLTAKRQEFVDNLIQYNTDTKSFVKEKLAIATRKKKSKSLTTWLSCPLLIVGQLGFHQFYLKNYLYGVLYILLSATGISGVLSLVNWISFLIMSKAKFDNKYNNEYVYYSQFSFASDSE